MFCRADYFDNHWDFCLKGCNCNWTDVFIHRIWGCVAVRGDESSLLTSRIDVMITVPSSLTAPWMCCFDWFMMKKESDEHFLYNRWLPLILETLHLHHPTVSFYSSVGIWLHPVCNRTVGWPGYPKTRPGKPGKTSWPKSSVILEHYFNYTTQSGISRIPCIIIKTDFSWKETSELLVFRQPCIIHWKSIGDTN